MLFVAGLFLFCFDRAVCVIDYFSLMEILKCFGLGLYCGSFLSVFFVSGVFLFWFWWFFLVFIPYASMLCGPEGN